MANFPALVLNLTTGENQRIVDTDVLQVGNIERATNGTLSIGTTSTMTAMTIGRTGVTTTVAGDLQVDGAETVTGTATFNGNTDIGDAATDTLTITAVVDSDITFEDGATRSLTMETPAAETAGGTFDVTGAAGGASAGTNAGGAGGGLSIIAGVGGVGGTVGAGGAGANLVLDAGAGGASGGGGAGADGSITIGANDAVDIGLGNATNNTTITQTGSGQVSFDGNVNASAGVDIDADNQSLTVGASADFGILHNATNTVATSATGDFILDNTLATGSTIMRLGTDTTATSFEVQNNSESVLFGFLGAGDLQVGGDSGTSGYVLTSGGAGAAPTWTDLSGTHTLDAAYSGGRTITADAGPIVYNFSTVAGGVLDINVAAGAAVLADAAALIDISYGANAYTGGASSLNVDWSGMTSLTVATDASAINLAGETNAGAGDSIAINIDSAWDQGIENASSYIQTGGGFTFSGTSMDLDPTGAVTLDMDAAQTVTVTLADVAAALTIQAAGGEDYLVLNTTGTTSIDIGNATDNPELNFLADGEWNINGTPGTSGQVLTSNGAGTRPTWQTASASASETVTGDWDTLTNSVAVGEAAAYTTTADRADQADATSASGAQDVIGICKVQSATVGEIIKCGRYTAAKLVGSLTINEGDRLFVSKTAGQMTNDVSAFTTGDKIYPVGYIRDVLTYDGATDFLVDMEVQLGESRTV